MTNPSSTVHTDGPLESSWLNDPLNYMVKAFICFLQTIYEVAPSGYFRWTPNPEESEIVITEENPIHVEAVDQRPVLSVIMGPTRFNGSSLDDLVNVSARDAKEIHTDLLPGTITINCVSRVPQEARFLAWNNARTIWALRKQFIRETHIHEVGRNISISPVSPAGALVAGDTEGEWHSVSVSCPFFLQWTDSVTPLKHDWSGREIFPLQQIDMLLKTRMSLAAPNLTRSQDAGVRLWGDTVATSRDSQHAARASVLKPARIRGRVIQQDPQPGAESVPIEAESKV